jgi:hypothetical protein
MSLYDRSLTPRMTEHARQRCQEMGVRTKIAKAIVRTAHTVYQGHPKHGENWIAKSQQHPEYAVAFILDENGHPVICTVLYEGIVFVRPTSKGA